MLMKSLISVVLLTVAITSNGAGPAVASLIDPQDLRPVPSIESKTETSGCTEEPGEEVREEFHQTYSLSPTGRVSLENLNGDVQIKVWDRPAVQVDAIKKAYRRDRLTEARIEVNSTEENIRIKTEYPYQNQTFRGDHRRIDNPATVDYTLTVPRTSVLESVELVNGSIDIDGVEGNVKASSINGKVNARGLLGEAKLSTINGPLIATFTRLDEGKAIALGSVNGNVTLVIPSNSNAAIRAGTVHGAISNDFGLKVKHGDYVGHSLDGQIGTGGPRIKLGNVNGGVKITRAQDGLPLSPASQVQAEAVREDREVVAADAEVIREVANEVRVRIDTERIARQAQRDAQRQVDAAMREAQREMERAQQQVVREQARNARMISKIRVNGDNSLRFTAKETKTFAVSGAPRITLNTFDGQVIVRGWDKPEVAYNATKGANDEETLKEISIQAQQHGPAITINTTNNDSMGGTVHFELYVPRQSTLHITSGDGPLNLDGVTGQITLRSGDGPIEVANGGGQLQVNTGDGVIRVIKFDGQVDARTGDGPISLEGNFNALSARTGDGEISLAVPAGSSFTIETNAPDEISNEGFVVAEDITPSPRVKRWKIGNGGRVFVLKTGEGRILLKPRQ